MPTESLYLRGKILFDTGRYDEAAGPLREAADAGQADAQDDYGYLCKMGLGVPQDLEAAERYYRMAAEQGHGNARHNLVNLLLERDGEAAIPEALAWLKVNAADGHARAQEQLGHFLRRGLGGPPDLSEALRWFREAAQQGNEEARQLVQLAERYGVLDHRGPYPTFDALRARAEQDDPAAMRLLGGYLMVGYGGSDRDEARAWFERAAAAGDVPALRAHGLARFDDDPAEAAALWQRAADAGDAHAQYLLALSRLDGQGIERDPAEAVRLLEAAAGQGFVDAMVVLGDHYRVADVLAFDGERAVQWYTRAAESGHAEAMWHLSQMRIEGMGVERDVRLGLHWLESAAKLGWADAQCALGVHLLQGDGLARDDRAGARWLRAAAEQGHAHGLFVLGACYKQGLGVPVDLDFARHCLRKAEAAGHSKAGAALAAFDGGGAPAASAAPEPAPQPEAPNPSMQVTMHMPEPDPAPAPASDGPPRLEPARILALAKRMRWSNGFQLALGLLVLAFAATWFWEPLLAYRAELGWTFAACFVVGAAVLPSSETLAGSKYEVELLAKENALVPTLVTVLVPAAAVYVAHNYRDWIPQQGEEVAADVDAGEETAGDGDAAAVLPGRAGHWEPGSTASIYVVFQRGQVRRDVDFQNRKPDSDRWEALDPGRFVAWDMVSDVLQVPFYVRDSYVPLDLGPDTDEVTGEAGQLKRVLTNRQFTSLDRWLSQGLSADSLSAGNLLVPSVFWREDVAESYRTQLESGRYLSELYVDSPPDLVSYY